MATYRILRAPSALHVESFDSYNAALAYSRQHGAHKPIRMLTPQGIAWKVATVPASLERKPRYIKLPHWERPAIYASAERALSHL